MPIENPTASSERKRKDSADFYLSSLLLCTLVLASEISRLLLKTDLLQQDRKNRDGNYSTILSYFYNYCPLLEHAVTSYNMQAPCSKRTPYLGRNRSGKINIDVLLKHRQVEISVRFMETHNGESKMG